MVPKLRPAIMLAGCGHWTEQERAPEVSAAMILGLWVALRRGRLTAKAWRTGIIATGLLPLWCVTVAASATPSFSAR